MSHRPLPDGFQAVIGRAAQIAEVRWKANRRAVWRLERAEIESVDDALEWLDGQAGEGGLVWKFATHEKKRQTAKYLLFLRFLFALEFEARRGER